MEKGILFIRNSKIDLEKSDEISKLMQIFQELNYCIWSLDGG